MPRGVATLCLLTLSALAYLAIADEAGGVEGALLLAAAAAGLFLVRVPDDPREILSFRHTGALSPVLGIYVMAALFGLLVAPRLLAVPLAFGLALIRSPFAVPAVFAGSFLALGRGLADRPSFPAAIAALALVAIALAARNQAEGPAADEPRLRGLKVALAGAVGGAGAGLGLFLALPARRGAAAIPAPVVPGHVEIRARDAVMFILALSAGLAVLMILLRLYGRARRLAAEGEAEEVAAEAGEARPVARPHARERPWSEPRWRVVAAYLRLRRELDRRGIRFRRNEDARAAAGTLIGALGEEARGGVEELTRRFERARYGAGPVSEGDVRGAREAAEALERRAAAIGPRA